jgi:restriction endonuclease Mrr
VTDAQEVEGTIETARSDYAGRCYLFTTGRVDPEARARAEEGGVQLVDGRQLAEFAREFFPGAAPVPRVPARA